MFSIRHQNRERRYGTVANSDLSDASSLEDDPHGRFVDALARIRRQRQEATINTFTCWCIRAAPILATATWTGTLIVLLSICLFVDADGGAFRGDSAFPPLSDVVARHVSVTLFGTISTAVFLMQSLEQERFLRYRRVLVEATEDRWLWISVGLLDCVLGAAGSVALFLLPLFNPVEFPTFFKILRATFFTCIAASGLLNTAEVEHLWHEHPDRHDLRTGAFLKYTFLWLFITCGTSSHLLYGFCHAALLDVDRRVCYRVTTASAILEWISCFSLSGFFATLALDVWPISRHLPVHPRFSASSQGLTHVHHKYDDVDDDRGKLEGDDDNEVKVGSDRRVEIPRGVVVKRLPTTTTSTRLPSVRVGYGNGWTDRNDDVVDEVVDNERGKAVDEPEFAWYELTRRRRRFANRTRRARSSSLAVASQ
ncbi:hypothetical protein JCM3766R1_001718 [Sporobolomyces carnicolor]